MTSSAFEKILAEVRLEFISSTSDRLTQVDDLISAMLAGEGDFDENLLEFQRHIHSIKGQGGTFDFPLVSTIAHRLEDYIETAPDLRKNQLRDMQKFVDVMRGIIESGKDPSASDGQKILADLPVSSAPSPQAISEQAPRRVVRILLIMEKGTQRRIIGKELASCGFQVINTDTPLHGLGEALAHPPDIIIASGVMQEMSGFELAQIIPVFEATQKCHIVIATSTDVNKTDLKKLPKETVIIKKGVNFSEDLTEYLIDWGYFGDIGQNAS